MFGPDLTPGFRGADLLGQADVRVSPDSLVTKSRQQVIQDTLLFADQWISPPGGDGDDPGRRRGEPGRLLAVPDVGPRQLHHPDDQARPEGAVRAPRPPAVPGRGAAGRPDDGAAAAVGKDGQPKIPGYMPRPFDNVERPEARSSRPG
jgi:hypothetical protein